MISQSTLVFFLLFFILPVAIFATNSGITSKLVKDLIENEKVPIAITVKDCWSSGEKLMFATHVGVSIRFVRNVTLEKEPKNDFTNKLWFVIDMNCCDSIDFLRKVNNSYFAHPYHWTMINSKDSDDVILNSLNLYTDSNVILASYDESRNQVCLKQVYKISKNNSNLLYEKFGTWDEKHGLKDERTTRIVSKRRHNLRGHLFTVSMVILFNDSLNHLTDTRDKQLDSASKTTYAITQSLVASLNATARYLIVNTWGYADPKTGVVNGMAGHLISGEADIGGTVMFMLPERLSQIEYISVIIPTRATFVFRAPPLSYVSNIFYLPFTSTVWFCSIGIVVISTVVTYLTYKLSTKFSANNIHLTASDFFLLAIGVVCQFGAPITPNRPSGRISFFIMLLATLFIFTAYTANIVALLQSTSKSINSIEALTESSMVFGIENTPYNRYYFPKTMEPSRRRFFKTRLELPGGGINLMNTTEGISKLRQGMFAFFMELRPGYKYIEDTFEEHEKCDIMEIEFLEVSDPWYAMRKFSPYKEMLKVNTFKIHEHGIQQRELNRIYSKHPKCNSNGQSFGSVRLIDCYAAILVLCYGFLFSFVTLLLEMLLKYRERVLASSVLQIAVSE